MKLRLHYCAGDVYEQLAKKCGYQTKQKSTGENRYTFEYADQFIVWASTLGDYVSGKVKETDKGVNFDFTIASYIFEK